jgi:hypothetical protein
VMLLVSKKYTKALGRIPVICGTCHIVVLARRHDAPSRSFRLPKGVTLSKTSGINPKYTSLKAI